MAEPKQIVALPYGRPLGDFALQLVCAASIQESVENSVLTVVWRPDRPFKKHLISMLPNAAEMAVDGLIPADIFDPGHGSAVEVKPPHQMIMLADLVLPPWMLRGRILAALPKIATLNAPELELDMPGDWHVVVHWRESGAPGRPDTFRDTDAELWVQIIEFIRSLGGKVVRMGHEGMTPVDCDLDLAGQPFEHQVEAIRRARFCVMAASGPASLASAMGTPILFCGYPGGCGVFHGHDMVIPLRFWDPAGTYVPRQAVLDKGLLDDVALPDWWASGGRVEAGSFEEICAGVEAMMGRERQTDHGTTVKALEIPFLDAGPTAMRPEFFWLDE